MPDTVNILRPSSVVSQTGWTFVNLGTAVALADDNSTTYAESPVNQSGSLVMAYLMENGSQFSLFPRAQIRRVRPFLTGSCVNNSTGAVGIQHGVWVGSTPHPQPEDVDLRTSEGILRRMLSALIYAPDGNAWTEAAIRDVRTHTRRRSPVDPDVPRVHELELHIAINHAMDVTVSGPADEDTAVAGNQVTSTSRPTIKFTAGDFDGDALERIHAIIYPESVYSQAGFAITEPHPVTNPGGENFPAGWTWRVGPLATNEFEWDSFGQVGTVRPDVPLENGNYRAWVFAADVGSGGRYSAPAYREWTQNVVPPPVPTLTAEVQ